MLKIVANRKISALVVALIINILSPAYLFAATEGHALDWNGLFYRILVFIIFVALLVYFLRKPIKKMLVGRREEVLSALNSAMKAKKDAENLMKDYEKKSKDLLTELEEMKKSAGSVAEAEAKAMIDEAYIQIEKMKAQAKLQIENELNKAKTDLRKDITLLALDEAEKRIKQDVKSATKGSKLMNQYIKRIGA